MTQALMLFASFIVLAGIFGFAGVFTARAREERDAYPPVRKHDPEEAGASAAEAPSAGGGPGSAGPTEPAGPDSTPEPAAIHTARYWWARLLSPGAVLGLLLLTIQIPVLLLNSYLIAGTLEVILDRSPEPLFLLTVMGWEREISEFDLIGLLTSLGQMMAAAALHQAHRLRARDGAGSRDSARTALAGGLLVSLVAGLALVGLLTFELGASLYRGMMISGPVNAALSTALALGVAATEIVAGVFVVDGLLIPLPLAVLWSIAAPFRALARLLTRKRAAGPAASLEPQQARPGLWIRILAAIDETVMDPLRDIDRMVSAIGRRARQRFAPWLEPRNTARRPGRHAQGGASTLVGLEET